MKTVLIVDADLSFAYWLGQGLDEAGYQAFPAKNIADAAALPDELKATIDVLIVNPALPGASDFVETLRNWNPSAQVVALRGGPANSLAGVDLWCRKPDRMDHSQRRRWIERVEQLLPMNLFSNKPAAAALGNRVPFELVSGWLWGRLAAFPREAAPATADEPVSISPSDAATATPSWCEWEGLTIDGRFALQRHLGGTERSAVFLADARGAGNTALKIVLDPEDPEALLARWEQMASLSHPGLVRVFGMGRCRFGGSQLAYLVMEYAEENLSEVLQQRPLSPAEAREMLEPVLETLQYVHEKGFVHCNLKPSNILAIDNQVKLASDGLRPAGQPGGGRSAAGVYDCPESAGGILTPAADIWSLGVTLVEALTLEAPVPQGSKRKLVRVPEALSPSFRPIALPCLRLDPEQRGTVGELVIRLRETASQQPPPPREGRWSAGAYTAAAVFVAAGLSALLAGSHAARATLPRSAVAPNPVSLPAAPKPAPVPTTPSVMPVAPLHPVLQQVLPDVSEAALRTVRGRLTIDVRVDVDAAGSIVKAELDSPGASPYFSSRALRAAQRWKFAPRVGAEADRPAEWKLQFAYTKQGATAEARPERD